MHESGKCVASHVLQGASAAGSGLAACAAANAVTGPLAVVTCPAAAIFASMGACQAVRKRKLFNY